MPSRSRISRQVDWSRLSREQRVLLVTVVIPISRGLSHSDVAKQLNKTKKWVDQQLKYLRETLPIAPDLLEYGAPTDGREPMSETEQEQPEPEGEEPEEEQPEEEGEEEEGESEE
jgi:hypothetical protein